VQQDLSLILVGVSHRTAPVEMRGQLVSGKAVLISNLQSASATTGVIRESVVVSTCNRLEIYAAAEDMAVARVEIEQALRDTLQDSFEPMRPALYIMEGGDAVRHLMRVAAGLDSLVLGETQILGQVSSACREATAAGTVGWLLSRVFASAIHAGRRTQTETDINRFPTSMSHTVTMILKSRLGCLHGRRVLLIGAGKMVKLSAQSLQRQGSVELAFVNRTAERAEALSAEYRGTVFAWDDLPAALAWADAAVAATGALEPVVRVQDLSLRLNSPDPEPLVIVDMAVPRNVEPEVCWLPGIELVGIDELDSSQDENAEKRRAAVPQVEGLIENEAEIFMSWYHSRHVSPVIADLRRKLEQVAGLELEMTLKGMQHLDPEHRKAMQRLVYRVTNKLLHDPTVRLKSAGTSARNYGQVVRHLFALGEPNMAANSFVGARES
jgi:glutamyl-tRNA reductase